MEKNNNIMKGSGENGKWITVNGAHIFVEDGQSVEDAMNKSFSKKDSSEAENNDFISYSSTGKLDRQKDFDSYQIGYSKQNNGDYVALTPSQSKHFKTESGAIKWLESKGYKKVEQEILKRNFSSKQELIDFVKQQTNVELKDDKNERFNNNDDILYARIPGKTGFENKSTNPVLSLLKKNGIRCEEHLNGGYWIYLNN